MTATWRGLGRPLMAGCVSWRASPLAAVRATSAHFFGYRFRRARGPAGVGHDLPLEGRNRNPLEADVRTAGHAQRREASVARPFLKQPLGGAEKQRPAALTLQALTPTRETRAQLVSALWRGFVQGEVIAPG